MIEEAKKRNAGEQIEYRVCGIEEYEYPKNMWDCVVSNLALHYIEDIENVFQRVCTLYYFTPQKMCTPLS